MARIPKGWELHFFGSWIRTCGPISLIVGCYGDWRVINGRMNAYYFEGKAKTQRAGVRAAETWLRDEVERWKLAKVGILK
jgi:hypothetical protein